MLRMERLVAAGSIIYDQLDFYNPVGSINRVPGVLVSSITLKLFVNNVESPWPLVDGSFVPDSSVCAGQIFFNETAVNSTFYSLRFFPDRIGFWRLILRSVDFGVEFIHEFDVVPAGSFAPTGPVGGLNASFVKSS